MIDVITDNTDTLYAALREINRLIAENERLVRDAKNDVIAYKAAIERQEELRDELEAERDQSREWLKEHYEIKAELDAFKAQREPEAQAIQVPVEGYILDNNGLSFTRRREDFWTAKAAIVPLVRQSDHLAALAAVTAPPATDALVEALEQSVFYLNSNSLNQIASGSKLHQLMREALATYRAGHRKESTCR